MTEDIPLQPNDPVRSDPRVADKPRWFTPIALSAIILGSLFGCCGATHVAGRIAGRSISPETFQVPGIADDQAVLQAIRKRNAAFQAEVFPYAMTAGALGMLHSLALLAAGLLTHRRREIGRKLFIAVCIAGFGVELVTGAVGLYVTKQTSAYTTALMKASLDAQRAKEGANSEDAAQNTDKVASIASKMTTVLGLGFAVFWFIFKYAYYIVCALYLRRREVADYVARAP